jgi:type I restriction enzyme, R subunit
MAIDYNEADTCRLFVTPALQAAGWEEAPHSLTEQRTFTDGRIIIGANSPQRGKQKRADYILRYRHDFPLAVVEAKEYQLPASAGLQQAMEYAEILGLKFAYATNGQEIIEHDFLTGQQSTLSAYPTPDELWARYCLAQGITPQIAEHLLEPSNLEGGKQPRYYQEIAINSAVEAILKGQRRVLLTMATGTGKTLVAFQICWKLWNSKWNKDNDPTHKPRILFLADRNILIDSPKDQMFTPFKGARFKIGQGEFSPNREIYFALYQAIAPRDGREGIYKKFSSDFFDLIVIDECHRGSARDDGNWREILEYFQSAYQVGMTATPKREDNADTYAYFGNPLYTYSLKQGIEDGFLAPYTVHRVVTDVDATGWRPESGQRDRYGREVPDQEYTTQNFERDIVLQQRTEAIAKHITEFLRRGGDPYAKTIVFCVDQEHAQAMRDALARLNPDRMRENSDYVCRITSDDGDIGRGHLDRFQDVEKRTPTLVTTSKLLTTGVDIPTCKNIAIVATINSMTEFKQIIGRGTRVRDDYDKLSFNILDYTGSATARFADPHFDGDPVLITEVEINEQGETVTEAVVEAQAEDEPWQPPPPDLSDETLERRKFYIDGVEVLIAAQVEYVLDESGRRRVVSYTDHTAEQVKTLFANGALMRQDWADPTRRKALLDHLSERGIDFERLMMQLGEADADPFDLLCHVAFQAPIRTRRERANRVKQEETAFFEQYTDPARHILLALLDKYAEHGTPQFDVEILKVAPISEYGNIAEIAALFGGAERLRAAMGELQTLLYAA